MTTNQWFRAAALLSLQLAPLGAQGVRPDTAFRPIFSDGRSAGTFVALQPDGKIVADSGRVRYFPDGSRDPSYALAPTIDVVREAWTAPDGRMFAQCVLPQGNSFFALLKPDGSMDATLGAAMESVSDAIFQPDGKLIVASSTVMVNGLPRASPVRFNRDGSLDSTFDVGAGPQNGGPTSLALQPDGKILLGGNFSSFDQLPRKYLVRLTANGLVDAAFNAAVDHVVGAVLPLPTGKIIAYDGIGRHVVLLNADGSLDRDLGLVAGDVYAFAAAADGRALALGGFSSIAGVPRRNLVRFNADGSIDPGFDASSSLRSTWHAARRFAVQPDGRIIVESDDPVQFRLLRLNLDGSPDLTFAVGSPRPPTFLTVAVQANGSVYVAGTFLTVNGVARPGLARLLPDGTPDPAFSPTAALVVANEGDNYVQNATQLRLAVLPDGGVVVAGTLIAAGSTPRQGVARFSATGVLDPALAPALSAAGTIHAVAAWPDGRILVGGEFSTVNGLPRANLATFRPDGTLDTTLAATTDTNGAVRELARRANGGTFLAGAFTSVAGQRRNGLAALDSAGNVDATFVPSALLSSDVVTAFTPLPDGGVVIAGPRPTTGYPRAGLRRLKNNGDLDPQFAFPFEVNAVFMALTVDPQGSLIAAYNALETPESGFITYPHAFVQRFAPTGEFDPRFNLGTGFSTAPSTLAIAIDGSILAGGAFTTLDDLATPALVRLVPGATPGASLLNISTRAETAAGANVLTAGFVIGGTVPKSVLIRAVGPSLTNFGVAGVELDPWITLFRGTTAIATNENWSGLSSGSRPRPSDLGFSVARTFERVGAFPIDPRDAALVVTLAPGPYTAQVGDTAPPGITLVEIYDVNVFPGDRRLVNLSSRGVAGAGDRTLIAGFVIGGTAPRTVLVRAAGPGLAGFNVGDVLADPTLALVDRSGTAFATNDDWSTSANRADIANAALKVGAFAFANPSKDAALLVSLPPGNYTAIVGGANASAGIALVEVYEIP